LHASGRFIRPGDSLCKQFLDPDQAQQNIGLDLRSKLFENLIILLEKRGRKYHEIQII